MKSSSNLKIHKIFYWICSVSIYNQSSANFHLHFISCFSPPLDGSHSLLPYKSFCYINLFLFVCDPLTFTRAIWVTTVFKAMQYSLWAHQWVCNWRQGLLFPMNLTITYSSAERGRANVAIQDLQLIVESPNFVQAILGSQCCCDVMLRKQHYYNLCFPHIF